MSHRCLQENLPQVSISTLVSTRMILKDATTAVVTLAGIEFEVGIVHRHFPNGGHWSFFACECGRRARVLKLLDGKPMCWRCCLARDAVPRSAWGSWTERVESQRRRREALIEALNGPPARLKPRPGRTVDRRRQLQYALQRSLLK